MFCVYFSKLHSLISNFWQWNKEPWTPKSLEAQVSVWGGRTCLFLPNIKLSIKLKKFRHKWWQRSRSVSHWMTGAESENSFICNRKVKTRVSRIHTNFRTNNFLLDTGNSRNSISTKHGNWRFFFSQFYWKIIGIHPSLDPGLQHDSLIYAHCEMITNIHHLT